MGVAALVAVVTIVWLMSPVGVGILLGVLMAFTFRPTYERLARHWSPPAAALATVLGSTLAMGLTFAGFVWILVGRGAVLGPKAYDSLGPGGAGKKIVLVVGEETRKIGVSTEDLHAKIRSLVENAATHAESLALAITSTTGRTVLALFFDMLTMYFILRQWRPIVATAQDLIPLRPEYTLKLLEEFRRVGRTTLLSTVVIGILQGALATVGYWIVGIPEPLFFGALTAVASLVPGLGTMLVWLPAAIVLVVIGRVGSGIFLAAWGVVVLTSIPTYVILPRLVGRHTGVPTLFTFIALFGGAAVFGLKGLIIGPVLMTMAMAVLRIYANEARERKPLAPT
ncbi:Membrane protein, putative [Labilithrix luteola]|uniref:Membrane protein, putative n=1 Tax=Labilithrix luteola TaxID=1391654 RepID=A0A0K1Q188_9BACT|nr:Membrane protein, putative [Labilithrix luteola]